MAIERSKRPVSATRIASTARRLLDASTLCAIATVAPGGRAHVNTAYFAWSPEFDLVWLSEPRSRHSRNLRANPSVAVAVYDSRQTWANPDRGIQLFGTAREVDGASGEAATSLYEARFTRYRRGELAAYRIYLFRPRTLKVFDEPALGGGVFVTARVVRGGRLVWERTERSRSAA